MQPLPVEEWDESLGGILDDMGGQPLSVHRLMANHPQLLEAWWTYRNYSVHGGDLEQRDCEIVILRVAVRTRCWYEWASHVVRGQASGLSLAEIERVQQGPTVAAWSKRDACLLRAVDELVDGHCVRAATQEELGEFFTPNQVMDIIATQGLYTSLSCMINTWRLELDRAVRRRLPNHITRAAFEAAVDANT